MPPKNLYFARHIHIQIFVVMKGGKTIESRAGNMDPEYQKNLTGSPRQNQRSDSCQSR
jgi:hypothetical protein